MQAITLEQLADILATATITRTIDKPGLLAHEITHPDIGKATTIQSDNDVLLIKGL